MRVKVRRALMHAQHAGRRQYFHDPAAPAAVSLLAMAFAVVRDLDARVLLVRRADDGNWELPGGRVEVGESASEAAVREVAEESAVLVTVTGVSGVYSDPYHVIAYPGGGIHQQLAVCFHAWHSAGTPNPDGRETVAAAWFAPADALQLTVHPAMRPRLQHGLADRPGGYFE